MKRSVLLLLSCAVLVMSPASGYAQGEQPGFNYTKRVGIAYVKDKSSACMAIENSSLSRGAKVRLIIDSPDSSQMEAEAVIEEKQRDACEGDVSGTATSYLLKIIKGNVVTPNVAVAVINYEKPFRRQKSLLVADLDGDGRDEYIRSCTSNEGIHLSIQTKASHTVKCRWHAYFYLDYDVEPTCTKRDCTELRKGT